MVNLKQLVITAIASTPFFLTGGKAVAQQIIAPVLPSAPSPVVGQTPPAQLPPPANPVPSSQPGQMKSKDEMITEPLIPQRQAPPANLHNLSGTGATGNSAVQYNPNAPTVPDYTQVGAPLPSASVGYSDTQGMIRKLQTGGTPEVYDLFPHWRVGWSKGFVIAPVDPEKTPFELRINGTFQMRYTGFAREDEFWTNSAGVVTPVNQRNDIQFPRSLITLSGYAYDEKLTYNLWLGGATTTVPDFFLLPAIGYNIDKCFYPRVGAGRIPFGSEFIIADFTTQFVDRSMATAFFSPDFAIGAWATGELTDNLAYWSMLGNGLSSYAIDYFNLDNTFVFGHAWLWDPIGKYGTFISDLEYHEDPALRFVQSYLWAPIRGQPTGKPYTEANYPRLSDGTLVTDTGALAPGVTVNTFKQYAVAQSAQFKYRGLSLFGEWFGQWYQGFQAQGGTIPDENLNIFNHGFTAQTGYFLCPKMFEVLARTSHVYGPNGHGEEYSVGFNYFHNANPFNKISVDFQKLNDVPAFQVFNGYVPGQSGYVLRLQYELGF